MAGPVVFEPPAHILSTHVKHVQCALALYETATGPATKAEALSKISGAAAALSHLSTAPPARLQQFNLQPHANAVVRIGVQMGLFEHLPIAGPATVDALASKCNADPEFFQRIARAAASLGMLQEVSEGMYAANAMSKIFADATTKAMISHMSDNVGFTMSRLNDYYVHNGYRSPADPYNTPAVFARGLKDIGYFEWLAQTPSSYENFNRAMAFHNSIGAKEIARTYPFNQLQPGADGVTLVDVAGGQGGILAEIIATHPSIAKHAVLQDLASVVASGVVIKEDQVKTLAYDFMKQAQPVKGASAYMLRHILHDWPDAACLSILRNQLDAMRGHTSRLLIGELVIDNRNADPRKVLRDINMMQLAGKERSEAQWHSLLNEAGFRIVKIHGRENPGNSVIEAVPSA